MAEPASPAVVVAEVGPEAAVEVHAVVAAAFGARPALDPPAPALAETVSSVAEALAAGGGLLARAAGVPVGALLLAAEDRSLWLRRVSVAPTAQKSGVARALVVAAEEAALERGLPTVRLTARSELPGTVAFWRRQGYGVVGRSGTSLTMARELPVVVSAPSAESMRAVGRRLAGVLRAGDLLVLTGELGAGKTTLTQGLGEGLGVRGPVTSPTFVIARVHPSLAGGPALVHADAYRLGGVTELDDLDLSLADSVTVVEWGAGLAEGLAEDRLDVELDRTVGAAGDEARSVRVVPVGARWVGSGLADVIGPGAPDRRNR